MRIAVTLLAVWCTQMPAQSPRPVAAEPAYELSTRSRASIRVVLPPPAAGRRHRIEIQAARVTRNGDTIMVSSPARMTIPEPAIRFVIEAIGPDDLVEVRFAAAADSTNAAVEVQGRRINVSKTADDRVARFAADRVMLRRSP